MYEIWNSRRADKYFWFAEDTKIITNTLNDIINLHLLSCSRIVKTHSEVWLVELKDKTLYFNSKGINEFNLSINIGILPSEEILIVN